MRHFPASNSSRFWAFARARAKAGPSKASESYTKSELRRREPANAYCQDERKYPCFGLEALGDGRDRLLITVPRDLCCLLLSAVPGAEDLEPKERTENDTNSSHRVSGPFVGWRGRRRLRDNDSRTASQRHGQTYSARKNTRSCRHERLDRYGNYCAHPFLRDPGAPRGGRILGSVVHGLRRISRL